jgi:hypothetical protein
MSKRKSMHRVTVAKRRLFGSLRWWATCTCGKWYQGYFHKQDAQASAAAHRSGEKS